MPALKDGVAVIKVTDSASLVDLMKAVEAGDMVHAMKELGHLVGGDAAAVSAPGCKCLGCRFSVVVLAPLGRLAAFQGPTHLKMTVMEFVTASAKPLCVAAT